MSALVDAWVAEVGAAPEADAAQTYEAVLALLEFRRSEGKRLDAAEWTVFLDVHERHVDDMVGRAVDRESTRWLAHRLQVYTAMADRRTELPRLWQKYEHLSRRTPAATWSPAHP